MEIFNSIARLMAQSHGEWCLDLRVEATSSVVSEIDNARFESGLPDGLANLKRQRGERRE